MNDKNFSVDTKRISKEIGASTKLIDTAVTSMPDLSYGKGLDSVNAAVYMMGYGCAASAQNLLAAMNNKILKLNDDQKIEEITGKFADVTVLLQSAVSLIEDIAEKYDMDDVLYFRDYRVDNLNDNHHMEDLMDQHKFMFGNNDTNEFH